MILKVVVLALFALTIIVVGILGLRRTRSFSDFMLGGRSVGPWMTAFTYGTAYFSAVLFIGFAGKIGWSFGFSSLWIALFNSLVGVFCVWVLLGRRIRKASLEYNVSTMPEFLEKRYDSPLLKFIAAAGIFIFFVPYSAAVFMGLSYLFKSTFSIDFSVALIGMGLFTALYISMGGYKSMTMIDMVFGIIMLAGVGILFEFTISSGGGLALMSENLSAIDPKLTKVVGPPGWWPLFSLVFLTSVAPFAMPQLVQKFYAIKDERSIKIGMLASTGFAIVISGVAYFIGSTARLFISPGSNPGAFTSEGKPIYDAIIPELLTHNIPSGLSVVILLLILAASMSTLAALVLISSSAVVKDFYAGFVKRDTTDRQLTIMMRAFSAMFVVMSVILAYFKPATIVSILSVSWGAIGAMFLGPFVWGLFSRRVNRTGAIGSSLLGLAVCMYLYLSGMQPPEAGTLGMLVSLLATPLISLVNRT